MFDLIFTPLRRVLIMFLLIVHATMVFFVMQRFEKAEVRAFFTETFVSPSSSQVISAKKPKIPFLIDQPATSEQPNTKAGDTMTFKSNQPAQWRVDHEWVGEGKKAFWSATLGRHVVQAFHNGEEQRIIIEVQ
ncbi:MAG: hypothetical protein V1908_01530 [Candidatus Peregrinibacteria bacterium]